MGLRRNSTKAFHFTSFTSHKEWDFILGDQSINKLKLRSSELNAGMCEDSSPIPENSLVFGYTKYHETGSSL